MDSRAWRVAGGSAVALLALVTLVAWRSDALAGGWLVALRAAGLVAVVGLLTAVVLASHAALRPPAAPQVLVRVPTSGAPSATAQRGRRALVPLAALVGLAAVSAAPALVVLVLARAGDAPGAAAAVVDPPVTAAPAPDPAPPATTASPTTTSTATPPTAGAAPDPEASSPEEPSPDTSSPGAPGAAGPDSGTAPPSGPPQRSSVSPSQLPVAGTAGAACEVVVAAGDSLWSLAAAQLGPGASDADVDARWRAVYAENADAVGSDPDRVLPGLALRTCA